jgi:hypothetical protein
MGRRDGGRVRRTLTAAQFIRKRRGSVERRERAGFEALIARVENEFVAEHRSVVRSAVHTLVDYHSASYAAQLVDHIAAVARDEAATGRIEHPDDSIVPVATRHLTTIMAYVDLAHVAHVKLRRDRLPQLRKRHGIARGTVYTVRDTIPMDAYERAQLALPALAERVDPTGSPLLCATRNDVITTTSITGALKLRRLRALRGRRERSNRHLLELQAAESYVRAVREALVVDQRIARMVADSGGLIDGFGPARAASRATATTFWGRIACQVIAIDRAGGDSAFTVTNLILPHVLDQIGTSGPLALWESAGRVLGIALHHARSADHDEAVQFARALVRGG